MDKIFFDGTEDLLRTLIVGVLGYCMMVALLRLFGKRSLGKMNAFDLVVTVALGSTLATLVLNKDVPLFEGGLAITLLLGLQFVVTWTSVRAPWVRRLMASEPSLLLHQGSLLPSALLSARVTEDEVRTAVRGAGLPLLDAVAAVILETDGSFSVIGRTHGSVEAVLEGVRRPRSADPAARHSGE